MTHTKVESRQSYNVLITKPLHYNVVHLLIYSYISRKQDLLLLLLLLLFSYLIL